MGRAERGPGEPGSYLGEAPWGLGREGHVRDDSTSVWPRLVTELCEGEGAHHHGKAGWPGGAQGQQGPGGPEALAGAGPHSSPVGLLPFAPDSCSKRENRGHQSRRQSSPGLR